MGQADKNILPLSPLVPHPSLTLAIGRVRINSKQMQEKVRLEKEREKDHMLHSHPGPHREKKMT